MSSRVAYFSICSLNYLHYARTLAQSLKAADPAADLVLFVADRFDERTVRSAPELDAVSLEALAIPHLLDMAFRYDVLEFNTAIKPSCIEFLFDRRGCDRVVYLDPDILVLKPLAHVTQALADGAECILTPHITAPIDDGRHPSELDLMRSGIYNLGFCAFANKPEARRFIAWWRDKLATDCLVDLARGIFVDQSYCDLAPALIARTAILRHPGYNLAYWNLAYRPVTQSGGGYYAAGEPLHFVHFSGIEPQNPDSVSKHQDRFRRADLGAFGPLYDDYLARLKANNRGPDGPYSDIPYGFDFTRSGARIASWQRRYYGALHGAPVAGLDPFSLTEEFWAAADPRQFAQAVNPTWRREASALDALSGLVRSPKALGKSLARVLWKGRDKGADYWQRRVVPAGAGEVAALGTPLARGTAIYGFFSALTGVGQAARGGAQALQSAGYPVSCHDVRPDATGEALRFGTQTGSANRYDTALLWLNADNTLRLDDFVPAQVLRGRRRIGHWAWELPVFPAAWAGAFDRVDEVWVPSAYTAASVAAATAKPVRVVPYAVDAPAIDTAAARAALGVRADEVLFACLFDLRSYVARKNPQAVLRAFIDAFPDRSAGARLLVKWSADAGDVLPELAALAQNHSGITLIGRALRRHEVWPIHAACDLHVSLHRAEGFGLNIAEAMALGKPAIVTNFSGNTDFTSADNALLIDFDMRRVHARDYPYGEGQWWAEPKHEAAVEAMRVAFRDAALRRRLGARARQDVAARLAPAVVGQRMAALLG